ncbi:stage II sporulation protein P [Cytobacillus massiliigabonensis]|uniref:stage II sporulation protein P n=1 Tax=Cytobacillus massiliigabonensis TaxID=1871011 RepID=UPI000C858EAB|nr:stage II sporulation protein P [Cytobacillus massiliigabonensis]
MRNFNIRTLKVLLAISIILFLSLLMLITFQYGKLPEVIRGNYVIEDKNKGKKENTDDSNTKQISKNKALILNNNIEDEKQSNEIIPDESAIQKDAALDQMKIDAFFNDNSLEMPKINAEKYQSTFGRKVAFIYFSHNRESFLPYFKDGTTPNKAYHSKLNVSLIGKRLGKSLKRNGIWNTVNDVDIINMLNNQNLNFGSSYQMSRKIVLNEMKLNHDLEMTFDIHRDALPRKLSTVDINGKSFAKISFVIGSAHDNYKKNMKFTNGINKVIEKNYPGLSRGVIIKDKKQGNGVYNQDLLPNSVIIEIGGVENNLEELYRTADVLGHAISQYYWGNVHK